MKIKLDENLPRSLVASLSNLGHDVETVLREGLSGEPDNVIWQAVQREERFLITQDLDFSNIDQYAPGTHPGLLIVRLRTPGRLALAQKIQQLFETEEIESWKRCFLVLTDRKLRIRRPEA